MKQNPKTNLDARMIALKVLSEVWQDKAYANIALNATLNKNQLNDLDRRFVTELVYGAVKAGGTLDLILKIFINKPLEKLFPPILNILRLGIYQIFFLDKIPDSAACNQAVNQAKKYGHQGTIKLVNAVLRNAVRFKESEEFAQDEFINQAILLQHPKWLIDFLEKRFGQAGMIDFCLEDNNPSSVCLRVNTLKTTREKLQEILKEEEIFTQPSLLSQDGLICESIHSIASLTSFKQGLFQIQDQSSMLVATYLDAKANDKVLDLCAAPGGKTTHIAQTMQNKGQIVACDIHEHKLKIIGQNAARLGITIIDTCLNDATVLNKDWLENFDKVLVDVPCSGLGVLKRRPDLRWRKQKEEMSLLPKLQMSILNNAAKYLKIGGTLIYSTCTINEEENFLLVEKFLRDNQNYSICQIREPITDKIVDYIELLPHIDKTDGFFICKIKREQ